MAGSKTLTYEIGIDAGDAVGTLRTFSGAVKSAMRDVESELDDGATSGEKLAAALGQIADRSREEFGAAATAAEEMGAALKRAGSSLDVADVLPQLQRLGLSFEEVTADADKLAVALKELDDVKGAGLKDLDSTAPGLASKLDDVSKSADSSKSALANMVGNSAQDLGAMTGLAGSAGVAIGQMAEYMADASFEGEGMGSVLKSFAGVAAPIAALALATSTLQQVMSRFSDSSKRSTASVEMWEEALASSDGATDAYTASLRELGKVVVDNVRAQSKLTNVVGELDSHWYTTGAGVKILANLLGAAKEETTDLIPLLNQAGISVENWTKLTQAGGQATADFVEYLKTTNLTAEEQESILTGLAQQQTDHAKAAANDAVATAFFGEAAEEAGPSAEELAAAQREATEAAKEHAIALSGANRELADVSSVFAEIGRRSDAISSIFDLGNAPLEAAAATRDIAEGIAGLTEAAKDVELGDIIAGNLDGDAVLDALDDLRPEIQRKVADAFAAGGPEAATSVASDYVAQIVSALGGKLTAEEVTRLLGLEDLEATVAVALDMSTAARVRSQLAVLTGLRGETPLTASIALALDAGTISPEAAEVLVRAQLGQAKVTLPTDVTPPTPEQIAEAGAFVTSFAAKDPAELATTIDPAGAERGVDGFRSAVEGEAPAEVPVDADTGDAEDTRSDFLRETERTSPIIDIKGETKDAIALLVALRIFAILLAPKVNVTADVSSAVSSLQALSQRTTRVPVDAYLDDYPSSAEIVRAIGRPRIPVDIVVGSSIRITGVRE